MKKIYNKENLKNIENEFFYTYSPVCKEYKKFTYEESCIKNLRSDEIDDYEYISILSKEKLSEGDVIHAKCSFEKFGAPLIVISDDVRDCGKVKKYGLHFEVVAWEKGCNVWHIVPWPERRERPIKSTLIATKEFAVEGGSICDIAVSIKNKQLFIKINGYELEVAHKDLPETFYAGITACEGINRFYEVVIEKQR